MPSRRKSDRLYVIRQPGDRFGSVTLVERIPRAGAWRCRCDCGREMRVQTGSLPGTRSCGKGSCNHQWTDRPSYTLAHRRVRAVKGGATKRKCERCSAPATAWAYNHADPEELLCPETGSPYSADPAYYVALCRSCHVKDDNAERRSLRLRIKELEALLAERGGATRGKSKTAR